MTTSVVKSGEKIQKTSEPSTLKHSLERQSAQPNSQKTLSILAIPQAAGNQAVQQLLRTGEIRPKLSMSQPNDPDEQEANRVADQVTSANPTSVVQRDKIQATEKPGQASRSDHPAASPVTSLHNGGQPLSSPVRAYFEPRFGHGFSQVRVHTDQSAARFAGAIQARAFTLGGHIVFGAGTYDPDSHKGQKLLAHELTHVVQQQRSRAPTAAGGATHVQRDTEVSTSSGTDYVPQINNTAYEWVRRHGERLIIQLGIQLDHTPLTLPIPEMSWRGDQNRFVAHLLLPLRTDPSSAWSLLPSYLRPDSLIDAVNIGRDCHPALLGSAEWKQGVVDEVARRMSLRLVDSLNRVARVAARHLAREWNPPTPPGGIAVVQPPLGRSTTGITVDLSGGRLFVPYGLRSILTGIAFSHPIDPFVYVALRESTDLDVVRYRAANPEDFSRAAIAADERPLREVRFRFLAGEGLPSWIRVTDPYDATVEEVANTLYGDPTAAERLTATPPLFGLPSQDMPSYLTRTQPSVLPADQFGRTSPGGPRELGPSLLLDHQLALLEALREAGITPDTVARGRGPEIEILTSPMADQAALLAAARIIPTQGATKELVRERLALIHNNLADMEAPAGELARPPDAPAVTIVINTDVGTMTREPYVPAETRDVRGRLALARRRVTERSVRIANAPDAEAVTWDGQTRGQLEIVSTALRGVRVAAALAAEYRGWPNIYELIKSIADGYVRAAEISDLYPAARAQLDVAERRSVLFPATALELWLAQIRGVLDEARTSEGTTVPVDPGSLYYVDLMDEQEQQIRDRLAGVRAQLVQNPGAARDTMISIFADLQRLQTGASLALNLDTVDRVWQSLYNSLSFMGEIRSAWGGGNAELSRAMRGALNLSREWRAILLMWRSGDHEGARNELQRKAQGREWRTWVNDMAALIHEHQQWDRLMTFVAMVGIAVLSGGIGAYVEGAVGAAWGVGAGASGWVELGAVGVGVLTEAAVFTTLSYPMTARDPSVGDFAGHFGQNLLFFGGGRALARGFQGLIGEARAATAGGRLATTAVVGAGFTGVSLLMANAEARQQRGRGLTGGEAAEVGLENVAFIGATSLASALLRRPLANLRLAGELTGLNLRHSRALRMLDATMHEVSLTPEPSQSLRQRLIADTQRAVESEQALANRMAQIVSRADALVDEQRPGSERARDRELARFGISADIASQLRGGQVQSQVLAGLRAMQGVRISRALEPVGNDFAIRENLYQEALAYFRSLPDTAVVESGGPQVALDPNAIVLDPNGRISLAAVEPAAPRIDPAGESFLVQPRGEAPFRVYRRARGAAGEIGGRVELAPAVEAAAGARDPMARPAPTQSGGRAGASEIDWGLPQEAIEGVRRALLRPGDLGAVQQTMRAAGVPASRAQLEAVKRYLFDSRGISFDRANYEAWQRLATPGRAQVRDIAFLVHELAEIRAFEQIRRQSGFDYRGADFERMTAQERQHWQADFNRYYLQAHSEALVAEYRYVADAVAEATNGRVRIGRNIAASVDPTRGEARANMMVEGRPLSEHRDFATWQARGAEIVEIGAGAQDRLRLPTRTPTLAELVAAVKRGGGGPGFAGGLGSISLLAPGTARGGSGRTGAEAGDPRVDPFLDTLSPPMAQRFRDQGHAAALRGASSVVDFLTRPGERNVSAFERFITESRLGAQDAIPILNDLLAAHPTMNSAQLMAWATAIRGRWVVPTSDTSPPAARLRAAVLVSRQGRYAGKLERAVADLRGLLEDNVELPVALNELIRPTDFGEPATAPVAGPGGRGPDIRFSFAGRAETVGREMYATDLRTSSSASQADAALDLHDTLMRGVREKAIDYTRPDIPVFSQREVAVQVRNSRRGYNFDSMLTQPFLDDVMLRMRVNPDTIAAGAQDILRRVVFYDSQGNVAYIWTR